MALLQIFRAGQHVASNGEVYQFNENDLANTATAYSAFGQRAPLVLGHPEDNQPEYGRVNSLKVVGNALFAETGEVDERLVDWVRTGRYKHVSAAFHAPYSPTNPAPRYWSLRHVGFLGAHPPAVKGMLKPAFGEGLGNFVAFQECPLLSDIWNSGNASTLKFSSQLGDPVDPVALVMHQRALVYQKAHGVSYTQALASCLNNDSASMVIHRRALAYQQTHGGSYTQAVVAC